MNENKVISTGFRLTHIRDMIKYLKTIPDPAYQKKVMRSFDWMLRMTIIIVALFIVSFTWQLASGTAMLTAYSSNRSRPGHVEGTKVWYIQNERHEVELATYGFEPSDYQDKDSFIVLLDKDNNPIGLVEKKEQQKEVNIYWYRLLIIGIITIIVLILHFIVGRKTYGKDWYRYVRFYEKKFC